ncbi:AT-hook motif nuclear-localized protein 10-like isoform X2 [Lycium barbarum]|uniref:AT-hook motif nuclear-localized protein 10-like isoform X2 n=1 Tax=Lycium barbarum TaxID=112863 RepID=UPI00293F0C13|nr:AT-hook motif nuclear-localized protein 10-like isoform X2 [Lycium barbarum]
MSVGESNGVSMQQNLGSPSPFAATDGSTTTYNPLMQPIPTSTSPTPSYINPSSVKRQRGRPRKYSLEGSANHGIISPPPTQVDGGGFASPTPPQGADVAAVKKGRGRPRGSGRKQQVANLGSEAAGFGFRPHVITIKAGEDVLAKLMSFSQSTSQAVCVLSANGSISNVSLWQAATSGGTVTYEGRFEILTLSGSFLLSESGGQRSRTGGLSVSLAGPDGRVLGGGVAGLLTAAASVQVIVGSFRTEGQRQLKSGNSDAFGTPATFVSGASAARSPPSLGTLSESSGGPVSAHNQLVETSNSSPSGVANLPWR